MSGVYRPTTLIDVLSTLNQNSQPPVDASNALAGVFGEVDETLTQSDSMTTSVGGVPTWDNGVWGSVSWG